MSVLVEALSLVIPSRVLDASWPGGSAAFLAAMCADDVPSRCVCTDGTLVSISFLSPDDLQPVVGRLADAGLTDVVDGEFRDWAAVDQRLGPVMPCSWLHWRRHRDGFTYAWLDGTDASTMAVPDGWTAERSRRLVRTDLRDEPERLLRLATEQGVETWLDLQTGRLGQGVASPLPQSAHPPDASAPSDGPEVDERYVNLDRIIAELEREVFGRTPAATAHPSASHLVPDLMSEPSPEPVPAPRPRVVPPIPNSYVVPGTRLVAGEYPGSPPSNPTSDLEGKLARFLEGGITAFVDLTDPATGSRPTRRC